MMKYSPAQLAHCDGDVRPISDFDTATTGVIAMQMAGKASAAIPLPARTAWSYLQVSYE